jgi:hypothetical protein
MRIYNGKDSLVCLPLNANQRICIDPHSVSGDFLPSTEFITMVISAYNTDELALIVASSFEINMCANIVGAVQYVVQSLDEAVSKFLPKEEVKEETKEEPKPFEEVNCSCENCSCNEPEEIKEEEAVKEEEPQPKKKSRKKSKD